MSGTFQGFPPSALDFYREVAAHNDAGGKAWFEAHRDEFLTHVVTPAQAFIVALGERLRALRPGLGFDPDHTGRGSFKKIFTDQRFQKDRPPFKTYAQMIFWEGPLATKKANSTFVVHVDPQQVVVGAGLYYFDGKLVDDYRAAVADDQRGGALADVVGRLRAAGYELGEQTLRKVPRGFPADHPRAELLRHGALFAWQAAQPVPPELHDARFVEWCVERLAPAAPLHAWCVDLLRGVAAR
jgi:uncharacterized protein (TIGR02453 family)